MPYLILAKTNGLGVVNTTGQLFQTTANNSTFRAVRWSGNNIIGAGTSVSNAQLVNMTSDGTINWQKTISGYSQAYKIALDSSNNIFVASAIDVGGGSIGGVITKVANDGSSILWERTLHEPSPGQEEFYGVTTDTANNVIVTGRSSDPDHRGIIIAKYNSSGVIQWQKILTAAAQSPQGNTLTTDSSDNIYLMSAEHAYQFLIIKWNSSGTLQWKKMVAGVSGNERGRGIAVNSTGDVYFTGTVDSVNFPLQDLVIGKLNSSGTLQWSRLLGDSNSQDSMGSQYGRYSMALDSSENPYLIGESYKTPTNTATRAIIAKYNPSGAIQYQRQLYATATNDDVILGDIHIQGSTMAIVGDADAPASGKGFVFKAPIDGSDTGTYGPYVYAASTINEQEWTGITSVDDTAYTENVGSFTDSAGSSTLSNGSTALTIYNKS